VENTQKKSQRSKEKSASSRFLPLAMVILLSPHPQKKLFKFCLKAFFSFVEGLKSFAKAFFSFAEGLKSFVKPFKSFAEAFISFVEAFLSFQKGEKSCEEGQVLFDKAVMTVSKRL